MAFTRIEELEHIVAGLTTKIVDAAKAVGSHIEGAEEELHEDLNEAVDYIKTNVGHLESHLEQLLGLKKAEAAAAEAEVVTAPATPQAEVSQSETEAPAQTETQQS